MPAGRPAQRPLGEQSPVPSQQRNSTPVRVSPLALTSPRTVLCTIGYLAITKTTLRDNSLHETALPGDRTSFDNSSRASPGHALTLPSSAWNPWRASSRDRDRDGIEGALCPRQ